MGKLTHTRFLPPSSLDQLARTYRLYRYFLTVPIKDSETLFLLLFDQHISSTVSTKMLFSRTYLGKDPCFRPACQGRAPGYDNHGLF
jgi:hypothetical protein